MKMLKGQITPSKRQVISELQNHYVDVLPANRYSFILFFYK